MRNITTSAVAFGAALLLGLAGASPSFAKSHDQGVNGSGNPGRAGGNTAAGSTVEAAQSLGGAIGGRPEGKGPDNSAAENAGGGNSGGMGGTNGRSR